MNLHSPHIAVIACLLALPAQAELAPFLQSYCADCHDAASKKGSLNLADLGPAADPGNLPVWAEIWERVSAGEMPPKNKTQPPTEEAKAYLASLQAELLTADRQRMASSGRTAIRRLSRGEFETTLKDLLDLPGLKLAGDLPADGKSHGLDRSAEALDFSFVHMESYLAAVDKALDEATPAFVERPPVYKYRYVPWQNLRKKGKECESVVALSVNQKIGIPLIGLERDGTFNAPTPHSIQDDPPLATAMAFFRREDADYRLSMNAFMPVLSGPHKLRVSGYSVGWDGSKIVPTERGGALSWGVYATGEHFGTVGVPSNEPGVSELATWLTRGGGMRHGTDDFLRFVVASCENVRDFAHGKNKDVLGPLSPVPGLAIQWIELEGPIYGEWPTATQKALFGDLPVRVWKKENNTPLPLQQTWVTRNPEAMPEDSFGERGQHRVPVEVVSAAPLQDAEKLLATFLPKAFRRNVEAAEIALYLKKFSEAFSSGVAFQDGLKAAYRAALTSPDFLLIRPEATAARLSYFLTSGPPELGSNGSTNATESLQAQAERMLKSPKSRRFVEDFTQQWLRLRDINATQPDRELYPEFTPLLLESMVQETQAFFAELLAKDLSVTHFVKSDFAMLNEWLAEHYGIPGVRGHALRRVQLPANSQNGPFLTQGSILKITANGTTTSPVTRGAFVMERLLGIVPKPPPPGAGSIEPDTRGATTIREQLDKHIHNASCAACHVKMDPYGFALEAFDVVGQWRDKYRVRGGSGPHEQRRRVNGHHIAYHYGNPVDASGKLPDGRAFQNITELRDMLASDPKRLANAFLGHIITYATGSPVSIADRAEVDAILERSKQSNYGVRTLILEFVASPLFSQK